MTTHTPHPPIPDEGLCPTCPRCQEIADDPIIELDQDNLQRIWAGTFKTKLDIKAFDSIYRTAVRAQLLNRKLDITHFDYFSVGGHA